MNNLVNNRHRYEMLVQFLAYVIWCWDPGVAPISGSTAQCTQHTAHFTRRTAHSTLHNMQQGGIPLEQVNGRDDFINN